MALNASKVKATGSDSNRVEQQALEAGNYLARVVQVLDMGLQPQRPYQGQEKPPAHEISITYELVTEFMKDEDGNDIEEKPRWISETFPLRSLKSELAKSTKRALAIGPKLQGDFAAMVGAPCTVTVVANAGKGKFEGRVFNNVGNVTPAMKGIPVPELVNDTKVFDLDEPDMEIFEALPEWIQDKMKANLEFPGSALAKALGDTSSPEEPEAEYDEGEDAPW